MNQNEFLADVLTRDLHMLQMTLADFSDADMLVRPVPTANHAAWQVGHLTVSEWKMLGAVSPGAAGELPAGYADKFIKANASKDDANFFPKKAELLEVLGKVRAHSVAYAKTVSPADLARKTPDPISQFAPTVNHLLVLMPNHLAMHIGQFQVIRRKLGKPILF